MKNPLDYPWFISKFSLNPVGCIDDWTVNCLQGIASSFFTQQRKGGLGEELRNLLWFPCLKPHHPQPWLRLRTEWSLGSAASQKLPKHTFISVYPQINTSFTAGELSDSLHLLALDLLKITFFLSKARHSPWQHLNRSCLLAQMLWGHTKCVGQGPWGVHFLCFLFML